MSGNVSQSSSDLYAVVDLSKKKKIKSSGVDDTQSSEPPSSLYSVLKRESPLSEKKEQHDDRPKNYPSFKQNIDSKCTHGKTVSHLKRYIFMVLAVAVFVILFVAVISMIITIFNKLAGLEAANSSCNEYIRSNISSLQNELQTIQQVKDINASLNTLSHEVRHYISDALEKDVPSCSAILQDKMERVTGNYIVRIPGGLLRSVYCDMTRTCGGITGGWMRVAKLDVDYCPPGLKSMKLGSVTACVATNSSQGCTSVRYPVFNMQYSKVCGQIRGYQVGSLDGFKGSSRSTDIGGNYLDGISVTSNRQHIWSFAAGWCNCDGRKPSFINNDWTCDKVMSCTSGTFCMPLLWRSQHCGTPGSSWFFKTVPNTTTTDIEVRVCRDQQRSDEDLAIKTIELYIQ